MAIEFVDNFRYKATKPNFERDSFDTLLDMKSVEDYHIDDGHISYCKETDKHYKFNSSNTIDSTTGKWRLLIQDKEISLGTGLYNDNGHITFKPSDGLAANTSTGAIRVKPAPGIRVTPSGVGIAFSSAFKVNSVGELSIYTGVEQTIEPLNCYEYGSPIIAPTGKMAIHVSTKRGNAVALNGDVSGGLAFDSDCKLGLVLSTNGGLAIRDTGLGIALGSCLIATPDGKVAIRTGLGLKVGGNSELMIGTDGLPGILESINIVPFNLGDGLIKNPNNTIYVKVSTGLNADAAGVFVGTTYASKIKGGLVSSVTEIGKEGTINIGQGLSVTVDGNYNTLGIDSTDLLSMLKLNNITPFGIGNGLKQNSNSIISVSIGAGLGYNSDGSLYLKGINANKIKNGIVASSTITGSGNYLNIGTGLYVNTNGTHNTLCVDTSELDITTGDIPIGTGLQKDETGTISVSTSILSNDIFKPKIILVCKDGLGYDDDLFYDGDNFGDIYEFLDTTYIQFNGFEYSDIDFISYTTESGLTGRCIVSANADIHKANVDISAPDGYEDADDVIKLTITLKNGDTASINFGVIQFVNVLKETQDYECYVTLVPTYDSPNCYIATLTEQVCTDLGNIIKYRPSFIFTFSLFDNEEADAIEGSERIIVTFNRNLSYNYNSRNTNDTNHDNNSLVSSVFYYKDNYYVAKIYYYKDDDTDVIVVDPDFRIIKLSSTETGGNTVVDTELDPNSNNAIANSAVSNAVLNFTYQNSAVMEAVSSIADISIVEYEDPDVGVVPVLDSCKLKISTGLAVDDESKLYVTNLSPNLIPGTGINIEDGNDDKTVSVKFATRSGLVDSNGIKVNVGWGLNVIENNNIIVKQNEGIIVNANGVNVNASNNFKFVSKQLDIKLATGIHSDEGLYLNFSETATNEANGFMSKEDKAKLDNFDIAGIKVLTQEEYDAIEVKDPNVIYYRIG